MINMSVIILKFATHILRSTKHIPKGFTYGRQNESMKILLITVQNLTTHMKTKKHYFLDKEQITVGLF